MTESQDTIRWVRRGVAIAALCLGWIFIAWQNRFHISAPVVFVCLAYLAVVAAIYNLWRTGVSAVDNADDGVDSTWAKPAGALGELEREKRTLLKAIKEAEFDHQMGKLSQRDADEMIRGYRIRAIEVIKEIDRLGSGAADSVREQILREVRARIQLDAKPGKAGRKAPDGKAAKTADDARPATGKPGAEPSGKPASEGGAGHGEPVGAAHAAQPVEAGAGQGSAGAAPGHEIRSRSNVPRDEDLDADSTTALEPRQDDPVKEATP